MDDKLEVVLKVGPRVPLTQTDRRSDVYGSVGCAGPIAIRCGKTWEGNFGTRPVQSFSYSLSICDPIIDS